MLRLAAASALLMLGACATISGPREGRELVGETLRVETIRNEVSTLRFRRDGTVRAEFGGNELTGRWNVHAGQLCFFWRGAPRECWRYAAPFERGRTVSIRSDRGNRVRVTRL